ncbi:MAG: YraN family protein [Anaerolineae bacterium]|nr:YraN family protein [Anaerolineae bacterium]
MPPATHLQLGKQGEDAAAAYVTSLGWKVLARNWRGAHGELDVIAQDGETVIFVEVKARRGASLDEAFARVDKRKQQHLALTAEEYLEAADLLDSPWRIDVIAVRFGGGAPEIEHVQDALIW